MSVIINEDEFDSGREAAYLNMAFGADKPFVMKIACAIFPPNLRFAQAGLAAQKIVGHL